jgi:hypothetical protein
VNAQLALPTSRTAQSTRWLLLKLFAYRARYIQLFHSCPHPGEGDPVRNRWQRKLRFAKARVTSIEIALGRSV